MRGKKTIGWVVTDQLETTPYWPRINTAVGGISLARLHWIAKRINQDAKSGLHYETYRPWRRYDALVFLKAMGPKALRLGTKYLEHGKPIIFDANVNYYVTEGVEHYEGMLPSSSQAKDAVAMSRAANAVIADSEYIAALCRNYNKNVTWIPDNVEMDSIPTRVLDKSRSRLRVVWSGEAIKLFELLLIDETLKQLRNYIDLVVITSDLSAMARWRHDYRGRIDSLLSSIDARIIRYTNMADLFNVYANSDVVLSPRFLDNTYNLGHTEWKITLGMACGCKALASPVPSYKTVFERSKHESVRLCNDQDEWEQAFESLLSDGISCELRDAAARTVEDYYSARIVATAHSDIINPLVQ